MSRNQHALLMVGYMAWIAAADMTIMNNNNVSNILQQLRKVLLPVSSSFLTTPLSRERHVTHVIY